MTNGAGALLSLRTALVGSTLLLAGCVRHVSIEQPSAHLDDQVQFFEKSALPSVSDDGKCMAIPLRLLIQVSEEDPLDPVSLSYKVDARKLDGRSGPALRYELFAQAAVDDVNDACERFSEASGEEVVRTDIVVTDAERAAGAAERALTLVVSVPAASVDSSAYLPGLSRGDTLELELRVAPVGSATKASLRFDSSPGSITSFLVGAGLVFGFTVLVL